jgi:hypothetical protein
MLVINADDFGMGENINRAIVRCFLEGICTSATIMPNMNGFDEACALAFEHGFYEQVGLHLVLNGGAPLSSDIRKEARFCNREGKLRLSRESPILLLTTREQYALAGEIRAQIRKCRERGIPITHVDSHHHFHTEWGIARVLIPIVREEGIPFVRIARNLVKNREIVKRMYKYFYNVHLRRIKLRATDYFGSVDEYLLFLEGENEGTRIIEVMIHPHYRGDTMYIYDSIETEQYFGVMGQHYKSEGTASFRGLHPCSMK